jgi:chromosome segregation ATPase
MNENRTMINTFRKEYEEHHILLIERTNIIQENLNNFEKKRETQTKEMEKFMMQNKMLNNALCGKVEKLEEMLYKYDAQFNIIDVNINNILHEVSNILERLSNNEDEYKEMLKIIKKENIGMRKVTTEMINNRMNRTEQMLDTIIKRFGGLEKENAELKEQLTEMQTEIKEINSREKTRKIKSSSESDDDHPKKTKSSGSSSSDDENDNLKMKKVTAHEVLNKLREPIIIVRTAEGKIEKDWYSLEIYMKKYAQFVQEINEYNGMLLAEEFNNNERVFEGVY